MLLQRPKMKFKMGEVNLNTSKCINAEFTSHISKQQVALNENKIICLFDCMLFFQKIEFVLFLMFPHYFTWSLLHYYSTGSIDNIL